MTDREKLMKLLDTYRLDSIESILSCFFSMYEDDISASRLNSIINDLNYYLKNKIEELTRATSVANERAIYLKLYLSGKMWKTEEDAKKNIQPQIDNAQAIIDACNQIKE